MAWFIGQSLLFVALAFLLGLLVGRLIWGRTARTTGSAAISSPVDSSTRDGGGAKSASRPRAKHVADPEPTVKAKPAPKAEPEPATRPAVQAAAVEAAPVVSAPEPAKPEPAVAEAEPAVAPEPVVTEPEPVVTESVEVEAEPVVVEAEPVAPEAEPVASEPEPVAEPVAVAEPLPVAEPAAVAEPLPVPQPLPVAEPVAVAEPLPAAEPDREAPVSLPADNLQRIEGIGPKISNALVAAGIRTYEQLAGTDQATLSGTLKQSGLRFSPSLPTWSIQAELLAKGDEAGFALLTKELVAGRRAR